MLFQIKQTVPYVDIGNNLANENTFVLYLSRATAFELYKKEIRLNLPYLSHSISSYFDGYFVIIENIMRSVYPLMKKYYEILYTQMGYENQDASEKTFLAFEKTLNDLFRVYHSLYEIDHHIYLIKNAKIIVTNAPIPAVPVIPKISDPVQPVPISPVIPKIPDPVPVRPDSYAQIAQLKTQQQSPKKSPKKGRSGKKAK